MRDDLELLAPAGSLDSLYAAICNGADAIYLGASRFSARAYASNFDIDTLKEVMLYCRIYGVKVYVTVNTLVKEKELEDVIKLLKDLYKIGIDGLIVQDFGVATILKNFFKDIEIHASTQMTIHNLQGALFLGDYGYKRVVLSRELSLSEITEISNKIETEIFIHGALCVSYSGQCLMSSMIGGRSGNRGRCAQTCRLPYTIEAVSSNLKKQGYLLSPKDLCTLDNVEDIIKTNTASLKIEGRMKRPEYVAGVIGAYRKAIDKVVKNSEFNYKKEQEKVLKLFNREGFSKAYLYKNEGKSMMAYNTPRNTGTFLGTVQSNGKVLLAEEVNLGDGIKVLDDGINICKILLNNKEVLNASSGELVDLFPKIYKKGDKIYKTGDIKLFEELSATFKNVYGKRVNLILKVNFEVNKPIKLNTIYKNKKYEVYGDIVQQAIKKPLNKEKVIENLIKTKDTHFEFNEIIFDAFDEGFMPLSLINEVRRSLLNQIVEDEKNALYREDVKVNLQNVKFDNINKLQDLDIEEFIVVSTKEQLDAVKELGFTNICLDLFKRNSNLKFNILKNESYYVKLPGIIKTEFNEVVLNIEKYSENIKGLLTSNLGIVRTFYNKLPLIGDYKLNIYNSISLKGLSTYFNYSPISVELNRGEISSVMKNSKGINTQALVYGKVEVMISEYCPIGSVLGGRSATSKCTMPCIKDSYNLIDRKNEAFFVKTDFNCRSYIYNNNPINLLHNIDELKELGVKSFRFDFIDEDYNQTKLVLESYKKGDYTNLNNDYTKGHYRRGVE